MIMGRPSCSMEVMMPLSDELCCDDVLLIAPHVRPSTNDAKTKLIRFVFRIDSPLQICSDLPIELVNHTEYYEAQHPRYEYRRHENKAKEHSPVLKDMVSKITK